MAVRLWVKDNDYGTVHEYGTNCHDSLVVDGEALYYHNLQNGEGTLGGTYSFCYEDGEIITRNENDDGYADIGGAKDVAEVKHGYWERKFHSWSNNTDFGNMQLSGTYPTCNLCNAFQTGLEQSTDYCPNCGARMDGDTP